MNRPPFLTFLCICTFIASSFGLFVAISNMTKPEVITDTYSVFYEKISENIEQQNLNKQESEQWHSYITSFLANNSISTNKNAAISKLIENILAILAGIFMWGLQKKGFFLYVLSCAVAIISPLFIYQGPMSTIITFGVLILNLVFVFLYYLNYKHLN